VRGDLEKVALLISCKGVSGLEGSSVDLKRVCEACEGLLSELFVVMDSEDNFLRVGRLDTRRQVRFLLKCLRDGEPLGDCFSHLGEADPSGLERDLLEAQSGRRPAVCHLLLECIQLRVEEVEARHYGGGKPFDVVDELGEVLTDLGVWGNLLESFPLGSGPEGERLGYEVDQMQCLVHSLSCDLEGGLEECRNRQRGASERKWLLWFLF